jgi:hypothetical protein
MSYYLDLFLKNYYLDLLELKEYCQVKLQNGSSDAIYIRLGWT